ncbi:hypothetical protein EW026_g1387 [Hermanssonia centrifuga]|uniref:Uncharacterized protein n=1 Tax=Hermanssonia centrifuga TaxID=98765 RepID=A0A4S4KSL2_9APHY|nr:hypothetical protein EW026_g1387 [Hermanssonia centrifuga]
MSDTIIRQVAPGVTIFSRPFTRFAGLFPMGGRSTAIKLSSGGVWVVASTPLNTETKETIDAMGSVEYILAASADHHLFLGEWKNAYPEAKIIGMEGLPEKKKAERWAFFGSYGIDPPAATYGFENDIQSCYFSGFSKKDVAWLHIPSKTLIVADLLFNLPAKEQYSKSSSSPKLAFFFPNFEPYSKFHQKFVWNEGKDKNAMKRDAQTVSEWDFERIIPCHGDVIEEDARKAWASAYTRYLST